MSQLLIHPANAAIAAKILLQKDATAICEHYCADTSAGMCDLQEALYHFTHPSLYHGPINQTNTKIDSPRFSMAQLIHRTREVIPFVDRRGIAILGRLLETTRTGTNKCQ